MALESLTHERQIGLVDDTLSNEEDSIPPRCHRCLSIFLKDLLQGHLCRETGGYLEKFEVSKADSLL